MTDIIQLLDEDSVLRTEHNPSGIHWALVRQNCIVSEENIENNPYVQEMVSKKKAIFDLIVNSKAFSPEKTSKLIASTMFTKGVMLEQTSLWTRELRFNVPYLMASPVTWFLSDYVQDQVVARTLACFKSSNRYEDQQNKPCFEKLYKQDNGTLMSFSLLTSATNSSSNRVYPNNCSLTPMFNLQEDAPYRLKLDTYMFSELNKVDDVKFIDQGNSEKPVSVLQKTSSIIEASQSSRKQEWFKIPQLAFETTNSILCCYLELSTNLVAGYDVNHLPNKSGQTMARYKLFEVPVCEINQKGLSVNQFKQQWSAIMLVAFNQQAETGLNLWEKNAVEQPDIFKIPNHYILDAGLFDYHYLNKLTDNLALDQLQDDSLASLLREILEYEKTKDTSNWDPTKYAHLNENQANLIRYIASQLSSYV